MKLARATIEGYRSINGPIDLFLDPRITILLGANDHGKSNLLTALIHLNPEAPFSPEIDLNWDIDQATGSGTHPRIVFQLGLEEDEQVELLAREAEFRSNIQGGPTTSSESGEPAVSFPVTSIAGMTAGDSWKTFWPEDAVAARNWTTQLKLPPTPHSLVLERIGIGSNLRVRCPDGFHQEPVEGLLMHGLPRVELFAPQQSLTDSVTWPELSSADNEFMRGILYYAGIDAKNCSYLFEQTDATQMELDRASIRLNESLRREWTQGRELEFKLRHNSGRIDLLISDPAVRGRFVRASRRSSGFTHFFTMKTALFARQMEHPASSYVYLFDEPGVYLHLLVSGRGRRAVSAVYLFDEPGVYLHPTGQRDLLHVLEAISNESQVIYSTHSIFMIDRNHPTRHRLLIKDNHGTQIDIKPYSGRWGPAFDALGVVMAGTSIFADYVLLCEGDSEAVLVPAILQWLIATDRADRDINSFAVIPFGDSRTANALIRLFGESVNKPKVGVMVDGDSGGKNVLKFLELTLTARSIPAKMLAEGTTIEDYLPYSGKLYVEAAARYTAKLIADYRTSDITFDELHRQLQEAFTAEFPAGKATRGIAKWTATTCQELAKLPEAPSKVGVARECVALLGNDSSLPAGSVAVGRAEKLAQMIAEMLDLPGIAEIANAVFVDE